MNFSHLIDISKDIHAELMTTYWILLPAVVAMLIIFELLKPENPNPADVLRRTVISVLLLLSFDFVTDIITFIGDGIVGRLNGYNDAWAILKELGPKQEEADTGFFDLRGHFLYFLAMLSYLIAYLGFFMAEALTHFVWLILHICSPLMILCFISKSTVGVTKSLYSGLIKVIVWKILWMILGALLLKMAEHATYAGLEDYLSSIVVNLCIGLSMMFVPLATKSLLSDGFAGMAGAFSAVPLTIAMTKLKLAAAGVIKGSDKSKVDKTRSFSSNMQNQRANKLNQSNQSISTYRASNMKSQVNSEPQNTLNQNHKDTRNDKPRNSSRNNPNNKQTTQRNIKKNTKSSRSVAKNSRKPKNL